MREKIISNTLFIVAALALIFAIVCFVMAGDNADYHGSGVSSLTFGADFYTEVHNAAAWVANNTHLTNKYLGELMTISGLGMVLVSVLCFGLGKAYRPPKITWEEANEKYRSSIS